MCVKSSNEYYLKNREEILKKSKIYNLKNKDKILEYQKNYRNKKDQKPVSLNKFKFVRKVIIVKFD